MRFTVALTVIVIAILGTSNQVGHQTSGQAGGMSLVSNVAPPVMVIELEEPRPAAVVEVPAEPDHVDQPVVQVERQVQSMNVPGECEGIEWAIPTSLVYRESRCSFDAVNPDGCGGQCVGAYQFDIRHFSGWSNGQAACADLDWHIPADQHECARRLSNNGTNLAPWGG